MKLSNKTMTILQNFSAISQSMIIKPGSELRARDVDNTIFAIATVTEVFSEKICTFNMPQLLGAIKMLGDPEIELHSDHLILSTGKSKMRFVYTPETLMYTDIPSGLPDLKILATFKMSDAQLSELEKAIAILGVDDILITGDDVNNTIKVVATVKQDASSSKHTIVVNENDSQKVPKFYVELSKSRLCFLKTDYTVNVCQSKTGKLNLNFCSDTLPVSYWVSVEKNSKVG